MIKTELQEYISSSFLPACKLMLILITLAGAPFLLFQGFFDSFTTIKWIIVLFSFNLLIILFLLKSKFIYLPSFSKEIYYLIAATLIVLIFNSFYHKVPLFSYENLRRILFWNAAVFFFNFFYAQKVDVFLLIEKGICFSLGLFVSIVLASRILSIDVPWCLTFGNINIAAEFVLIYLVFPLGLLTRLWKDSRTSWPLIVLVAGSLAYVYFSHCRSVSLCCILLLTSTFFLYKAPAKEIIKILFISLLLVCFIQSMSPSDSSTVLVKPFSVRWGLYLDTLMMILQNPLGVGVGQFEFSSLPYVANLYPEQNESIIFLTPHNEFLRYLSEDGVLVCLLIVILCSRLVYTLFPSIKAVFSKFPEFLFLSIVLGVQGLFQFPLVEPLPYFITAMMVGRFFSLLKFSPLVYKLTPSVRVCLSGGNILIFSLLSFYFASQYISTTYSSHENVNKRACSFLSRDWVACLNVASLAMEKTDLETAEKYALHTLEWHPLNYHGIKMLGLIRLMQGNRKEACRLFQQYDSFFQNKSSVHEIREMECF